MEDLLHRRLSPLESRLLAIHGGEYVNALYRIFNESVSHARHKWGYYITVYAIDAR
jgi:hypothetical protein